MSRKTRALIFLLAAGAAGLLAVSLIGGYSSSVADSYGRLRTVIALTHGLMPGQVITPRVAATSFELRRVPARFVPVATLDDPRRAIGLEPVAPMPAGSYLTEPGLRPPPRPDRARSRMVRGRHAVAISVAGAGALAGPGVVDVLVTSEGDRGHGRTRLAARGVPLISLGQTGQSDAGPGLTEVTLGLSRSQAMELIDAESFARRITVLPRAGG
ncbi:MAG: SAF domain-containing protein [Solirubrobacterales bacterium]|nr:SAF domain-containing protein [Solirubrobacterales bacterium]